MKNTLILILALLGVHLSGYSFEYHVSVKGNDNNSGTVDKPFRNINRAAAIAVAGDTITVHAGTYREWVNPKNGGISESWRILYRAAPGEKVEIKGSEVVTGWKQVEKGVWKIVLPNSFFGDYNPCADMVYGDWCNNYGKVHTADLYLNGKSLFEMDRMELVKNPVPYEKTRDKEGSLYTWFCEVSDENTTIWANFQKQNPNQSLTELSIRKTCFYPNLPGINYITISGFDISQAATQWAAPTAEQIGMVATHWNKGWIIEDNIIHDTKATGITLGKDSTSGHNVWSRDPSYDGSVHYIEVTFNVLRQGWNKEKVGSHLIRNNTIYNCEQAGICGSFGAAFSRIENNHIYNILQKKQFTGAEMAGVKLHAAVDVVLEHNRIHDVGAFGYWMDWMAQGTRITRSLLYRNDWQDIFFEVDHGPYIADNNIMLSDQSLLAQSEGGAYIHNLFGGSLKIWSEPNRYTPYFLPHSTEVAALVTIKGGDDRFHNNIFLGKTVETPRNKNDRYGLSVFNTSADKEAYGNRIWPVWIDGNMYFNGALPFDKEINSVEEKNTDPGYTIIEDGSKVYLQFNNDAILKKVKTHLITTSSLVRSKVAKAGFENSDGSSIHFDQDFLGNKRNSSQPVPGPIEQTDSGTLKIQVWGN